MSGFVLDIFLGPGELFFGDEDTRIRTILGSCVSITFWHPAKRIGGMCHYVLPTRGGRPRENADQPQGWYADDAMALMIDEIRRARTRPSEYQVKIFGGGRQFVSSDPQHVIDVPQRNVKAGMELLERNGLTVVAQHLGGTGARTLLLDVSTGDVWLRHTPTEIDHQQQRGAA